MDIPSMAWMEPDKSLAHPSLFPTKPNMMWGASLSEFILNRVCELVKRGVKLTRGFKEHHLQSVCNDVLDFTGVEVTPTRVYNHMRKWKQRWAMVCKVKNVRGGVNL
jgi:hypothetical protein